MTKWTHIKHKIAFWLYSDVIEHALKERQLELALERVKLNLEKNNFEIEKENYSITDAIREQLKGFNTKLLDNEDDLLDLVDKDEINSFLESARDLSKNDAFIRVAEYVTRNQILFSAKDAITLEQLNFGRATINGVSLFQEEVESLVAEHARRNEKEEDLDDEEKFNEV